MTDSRYNTESQTDEDKPYRFDENLLSMSGSPHEFWPMFCKVYSGAWLVEQLNPPHTIRLCSVLLQNEHSASGLKRASLKSVEIDAAGNGLSDLVSAVPIGSSLSG